MPTKTQVLTVLRIFFLIFMIVAACVGISGNIIENKDNDEEYVTIWETKSGGTIVETNRLACSTLKNRLLGIAGISIIAIVFYFVMLIVSIIDLVLDNIDLARTIIFNVLNFISFVFIMTSWAAEGHFYHSTWCASTTPADSNFKIGYGLALLVVVWIAQILASIVWIITKVLLPKTVSQEPKTVNEPTTEDEEAARQRKEQRRAERRAKAEAETTSAAPKTGSDAV